MLGSEEDGGHMNGRKAASGVSVSCVNAQHWPIDVVFTYVVFD